MSLGIKLIALICIIGVTTSCLREKVDGIVIGNTFLAHQSWEENKAVVKAIQEILARKRSGIEVLINIDCGGAAACYDLGFVISQIVYRVGENEFIKMVDGIEQERLSDLSAFISIGLLYGDNNMDGKIDEKRIEDEFPNLNTLLRNN